MRFIADRMLGRLAKWMRALGIDVYYDKDIERSSLIKIAREEGRQILTRAGNFCEIKHIPPFVIIRDELLEGQLRQIVKGFGGVIKRNQLFSRCMVCNSPLEAVSKKDVSSRVPSKAYQMHNEYKSCPDCKRVYWEGTHVLRMRKLLSALLSGK